MKFILLTAHWEKNSSVNSWVNKIFDLYSDRKAIFVTHSGLSKEVINDTYLVDSIVIKNDNIFLGLMGHLCESTGEEYWTTTSKGGNTQHLIRSDYQCRQIDNMQADSNTGVRHLLTKYNMRNFSIFMVQFAEGEWYEFGYFE